MPQNWLGQDMLSPAAWFGAFIFVPAQHFRDVHQYAILFVPEPVEVSTYASWVAGRDVRQPAGELIDLQPITTVRKSLPVTILEVGMRESHGNHSIGVVCISCRHPAGQLFDCHAGRLPAAGASHELAS